MLMIAHVDVLHLASVGLVCNVVRSIELSTPEAYNMKIVMLVRWKQLTLNNAQ